MIDSDEIKQRIDIVEYISRYTPLTKAGRQYKGLCPFHTEKSPSFYVYPDQGRWHCYGACSEGGDLISFVMKKESLSFVEAMQKLGRELGIDVDQGRGDGVGSQRELIYQLNSLAKQYFSSNLRNNPRAAEARAYLERRGIDAETIAQFGIGYAPDAWSGLRDYLSAQGYDIDLQLTAGLIKRNEEKETIYDVFRNRVVVPITDRLGRIIGFGGRVLDDGVPKYLNTAETPVFRKSRVVFGIDKAYESIRDLDRVVIVEGYMDVIAAHQFGYTNVVACMGTALTSDQLVQMQRYTRNFVFALDADSAGKQATIRGLNQARQALARVSKPVASPRGGMRLEQRLSAELFISSMPSGMDPDDVIRHDPLLWEALILNAQPLVDYFISEVAKQYDLASASGKVDAVSMLTPLIAELSEEIEQQHYIQQLSRLVEVDEATIAGRVRAAATTSSLPITGGNRRNRRQSSSWQPPPIEEAPWVEYGDTRPKDGSVVQQKKYSLGREDHLLASLLQEPESIIWLSMRADEHNLIPPRADDWRHIENQEIFRALKRFVTSDVQWDAEVFQQELAEPLHGRLGRLYAEAETMPVMQLDEVRSDMLKVLVNMRIDGLKADNLSIKFLMADAQRSGEVDVVRSFDSSIKKNLRELSHLQSTLVDLTRVLVAQRRTHMGVKVR